MKFGPKGQRRSDWTFVWSKRRINGHSARIGGPRGELGDGSFNNIMHKNISSFLCSFFAIWASIETL